MDHVFTDWTDRHAALFGKHTINIGHRLHEWEMFSDDALALLIEKTPRESYHVNTMDPETHDPRTRREGVIDGLSGHEVLDAVRNGTIWIMLQNPGAVDPAYGQMLETIYREVNERVPGLATFRERQTILISSPRVQVYYHCDIPGQTLWQIRGRKRVYVYPNSAPFLPQPALERIVLGEAHEISLDYEPWFDEYAEVVELEPGRMLHWPLNCPHRIVNADCLNVSFTTEHWTRSLREAYAINYANGLIRKRFPARLGSNGLSQSCDGAAKFAKMGLAGLAKLSRLQKRNKAPFRIDFTVDPDAPHGIRDVAPHELRK